MGTLMVFTRSDKKAEQHVIIAGAGRVGHRTARVLHDYGHEVYLIERDSETVDAVTGRRTGVVIEGDATDPNVLRQAEPERADVLTALTGDGTTNVAICAEMQHLTDQIRSIARVCGPERPETATEFVDEFIYPERVGSKAVINNVQEDDIRTLEDITGDLDVLDIRVGPRSPVAGKQLKEILFPDGSQVISDADGTEVARPETTLRPGRRYLVAAEPSVADDVHKLLVG
jgi:trk system potassium uptake protein TrkA